MDLGRSVVTVHLLYKYSGLQKTNTENFQENTEMEQIFKGAWVMNKSKAETAHGVTADISYGNRNSKCYRTITDVSGHRDFINKNTWL